MKIEFTEEILKYCYEENKEYRGFLTSCEEILIPYILKNHKKSLKEYIELDNIELISRDIMTEIKVFNTYRVIKISEKTFKNIEEELIRPLYHSLKGLQLKYTLRIGSYLHIDVSGDGRFAKVWREFLIKSYGYNTRVVCPSLNVY